MLPMKGSIPSPSLPHSHSSILLANRWLVIMDNLSWGNNNEASSSSGSRRPRLSSFSEDREIPSQLSLEDSHPLPCNNSEYQALVLYNAIFARSQILEHIHGHVSPSMDLHVASDQMEVDIPEPESQISEALSTPLTAATSKKRRAGAKTPIVDDEVRRCSKFRKDEELVHVQLEKEPRRKKGATRRTVTFSEVADLKKAIVSRSLEEDMEEAVVDAIPAAILVELGNSFCGIPPMELSLSYLQNQDEANNDEA